MSSFEKIEQNYKAYKPKEAEVFVDLMTATLSQDQYHQLFDWGVKHQHLSILDEVKKRVDEVRWWSFVENSIKVARTRWVEEYERSNGIYAFRTGLASHVFADMKGIEQSQDNEFSALEKLMVLTGASQNEGLKELWRYSVGEWFLSSKLKEEKRKEWLFSPHKVVKTARNIDVLTLLVCSLTGDLQDMVLGNLLVLGADPDFELEVEGGSLSLLGALLLSRTEHWSLPFPKGWPVAEENRSVSKETQEEWFKQLQTMMYFLSQSAQSSKANVGGEYNNAGLYLLAHKDSTKGWPSDVLKGKISKLDGITQFSKEAPVVLLKAVKKTLKEPCSVLKVNLAHHPKIEELASELAKGENLSIVFHYSQLMCEEWKSWLTALSKHTTWENLDQTVNSIPELEEILIAWEKEEKTGWQSLLRKVFAQSKLSDLMHQWLECAAQYFSKDSEKINNLEWILKNLDHQAWTEKLLDSAKNILSVALKNQLAPAVAEPVVVDDRPKWTLFKKEEAEDVLVWLKNRQQESETLKSWAGKIEALSKGAPDGGYEKPLALGKNALDVLAVLKLHFPHFHHVIDVLDNHLNLSMCGDEAFSLPPLLLVGPPGTGKTFFFQQLSLAVATSYHILNMESVQGSFSVVGGDTGWSNAAPGFLFESLLQESKYLPQTANPILLLDEIDKCADTNFPVAPVLLSLLESHSAKRFTDRCIPLPLDTRKVCWVATANDISRVSKPIQSRFTIIEVENPNFEARRSMAQYIYASILKDNAWGKSFAPQLSNDVLDKISRPSGAVREMKKQLLAAAASAAKNKRQGMLKEILPEDVKIGGDQFYLPWDQPFSMSEASA